MNNTESVLVIEFVQEIFDLLRERQKKLEIELRAHKALGEVDNKLALARMGLWEFVRDHGELHIDMNGEIFKIASLKNDDKDVLIEPCHIDCRRITAETD